MENAERLAIMYGLRERDLEYIHAALSKCPQVEKAIIFGSRALGNYKKGSDIDLAKRGKKINESICKKIRTHPASSLPVRSGGRPISVIRVPNILAFQIFSSSPKCYIFA